MKDGHFHVINATKDLRVKMVCNDIIGSYISMHKENGDKGKFQVIEINNALNLSGVFLSISSSKSNVAILDEI